MASALFPTQDLKKGVLWHLDVESFFLVSMAELFSVVNSMLSCCRTSANPMLDMLGICVNSTYLSGHHIGVPV